MATIAPTLPRSRRRRVRDDDRDYRSRRDDDRDDPRGGSRPPVATTPGAPSSPVAAPAGPAAPQQYYGRLTPGRPIWEMNLGNTDTAVAYTPGYTPPVAAPAAPPSAPGASPAAPSAPPTAVSSYAAGSGALVAPQSGMSGILFGPPDGSSGAPGVPTVGTWNRALWGKPYTPSADWTRPANAYGALMDSGGTVTVDPNSPFGENYTGMFGAGYTPGGDDGTNVQANEPVAVVGQDSGTTYAQTGADQQETLTFTPTGGGIDYNASPWLTPSWAVSTPKGGDRNINSVAAATQQPVQAAYNPPIPTDSNVTNSLSSILAANPQMKATDAYELTKAMQEGQAAIQRGAATPQEVQQVLSNISSGFTPHVPDMTNYRPVAPPVAHLGMSKAELAAALGMSIDDPRLQDAVDPTVWTKAPPLRPDEQGNINPGRVTPPDPAATGMVSGSGRGFAVHATADPKFDGTGRTLSQIRGTEYWSDEERAWYLMMIGKPLSPAGAPASGPAVGPDGRTVAEIRGTDYFSPEERTWYLQQIGQAPTPAAPAAPATGVTPPAYSGGSSNVVVPNYNQPGAPATPIGQTAVDVIQRYFPPGAQNMAYHVVAGESGGGVDPSVISPPNSNGSRDYGIFQINSIHFGMPVTTADGTRYILNSQNVLDPDVNAAAARQIYNNSIAAGRDGWFPWSTTPKINANGVR